MGAVTETTEAGAPAAGHLHWQRTTVQGRAAVYGEAGPEEGRPVLFLHGWGLGHHAYKRPLKRLANRGCRVLAPALPGFGGTADLPADRRTIAAYGSWVGDFLDAVGVREPAVVIGHSFGGGTAVCMAHDRPDLVDRLVLVNSVGGAAWGDGTRSLSDRPLWRWGIEFARDLTPLPQGLRVVATMREDLVPNLLRNPRALWDVGMLAARADLRAELADLRERGLPVLVVSGDSDTVIPVSAFEAMCDALGIEGTVLHGNHCWLLADPDAFDEVLANVIAPPSIEPEAPHARLRRLLAETTVPDSLADRLVDEAPALWLASDATADLASDLGLLHPPLVEGEVRARASEAASGGWRLTVAAHDRVGMLADTAGVLAAEGLSITTASVATWTQLGMALHAVCVDGPLPPAEVLERIGRRLQVAAADPLVVDFAPVGRASVSLAGEANGDPILTVTAPDQPGLLFAICRWLADNGGSIEAAGIGGGGDTIHDVFIVRNCPDPASLERHLSQAPAGWLDRLPCRFLAGLLPRLSAPRR